MRGQFLIVDKGRLHELLGDEEHTYVRTVDFFEDAVSPLLAAAQSLIFFAVVPKLHRAFALQPIPPVGQQIPGIRFLDPGPIPDSLAQPDGIGVGVADEDAYRRPRLLRRHCSLPRTQQASVALAYAVAALTLWPPKPPQQGYSAASAASLKLTPDDSAGMVKASPLTSGRSRWRPRS